MRRSARLCCATLTPVPVNPHDITPPSGDEGVIEIAAGKSDRYRPMEVVDLIGFEPGSCDMVLVVDCTSSPAFTLVRVCERLKVPPSCACARVFAFSTGPLP